MWMWVLALLRDVTSGLASICSFCLGRRGLSSLLEFLGMKSARCCCQARVRQLGSQDLGGDISMKLSRVGYAPNAISRLRGTWIARMCATLL